MTTIQIILAIIAAIAGMLLLAFLLFLLVIVGAAYALKVGDFANLDINRDDEEL